MVGGSVKASLIRIRILVGAASLAGVSLPEDPLNLPVF